MEPIAGRYLSVGKSWQRALKRTIDIAVSGSLLLLFSPLFVALALAVCGSSPGGPIFRSVRVGRRGQRFRILKFRTMRSDVRANESGVTASGDPRITRVGAFLRKSKLDELPQLLNVLVGQMSLVGPRPEDERFVSRYTLTQRMLLTVRPGITGPATVRFRSEEELLSQGVDPLRVYLEQVLPAKCAIDMSYLLSWSLRADARVVIATAVAIVRPPVLPTLATLIDQSDTPGWSTETESTPSRMHVA